MRLPEKSAHFLLHKLNFIWPGHLEQEPTRCMLDLDDYRIKLFMGLQEVRQHAFRNIVEAQARAKNYYDRVNQTKSGEFKVGDRVLVLTPNEVDSTPQIGI